MTVESPSITGSEAQDRSNERPCDVEYPII